MKYIYQLLLTVLFSMPFAALAKEVSLFDTPDANAKVIGKIDVADGIVPIFSSKDGQWMKVGDPKNGNVGWIKSNDINNSDGSTSFTFTQRTINDGNTKGGHTIQVIQYGSPTNKQATEQAEQVMNQMRLQQINMQRDMQSVFQRMFNEMNSVYNIDMHQLNGKMPIIMPVVILPVEKPAAPVKR